MCGFRQIYPRSCTLCGHSDGAAREEGHKIDGDDGGADGRGEPDGKEQAQEGAHDGKSCGKDGHFLKTLKEPHSRKRRKDDKRRNEQRPHEIHREHDDDGDDGGDHEVVKLRPDARGLVKGLVEGDGKDLVIQEYKDDDDGSGQSHAHPKIKWSEFENGGRAEQRRADVARDIGRAGKIVDEIADRESRDGDEGELRVTVDLCAAAGAQEQHGCQDGDGQDDEHLIGDPGNGCDCHRPERDAREAVADEGKAFQDERYA